jgi:hypothetical protein
VGFLAFGEFGLFAAEPAFGFGDLHAFAGSGADEVGFEFGDHGQDVEEEPADGVGGVVYGSADAEFHVPFGEVFDDVPGVRQGAGEPVEFGDDESVAGPDRGEGFPEARPFPVPAGQSVVDVDPVSNSPFSSRSIAGSGGARFVVDPPRACTCHQLGCHQPHQPLFVAVGRPALAPD